MFGYTEDTDNVDTDKKITSTKKRRIIADNKLRTNISSTVPQRITIKQSSTKINYEDLATNVVEILKEEIDEFSGTVHELTKEYSDFLRTTIVPHMIAFDAAVEYNRTLLTDGLGRNDISTDDSLSISLKWMLHLKVLDFLNEKLKLKPSERMYEHISDLMKSELAKSVSYNSLTTLGRVISKGTA